MGEFTRWFNTDDEADQYIMHMRRDRGYHAERRHGMPPGRMLTPRTEQLPAMCQTCPYHPDNGGLKA